MALAARSLLRNISRRLQVRTYADAPKEGEMAFTFAAGNKVFYDKQVVKQVDVPSFSGSFGILPKHVPTLAVLRPGVVTVLENDGKQTKIFVSSGTITVNEDSSVQVLVGNGLNECVLEVGQELVTVFRDRVLQDSDVLYKVMQVLAEEAHPLENLDRGAAQEALSKAQSELNSAANEQAKAEAAIAVEVAEEIVKAASA